jgi:GNAT superfamily N-acetyltransferase
LEVQVLDARSLMPNVLENLLTSAVDEGIGNISRLVSEWDNGKTLFNGQGEFLYIAQVDGETVGVGGLLLCKDFPGALRVSRFYVLPGWRREGIGRALAYEILHASEKFAQVLTCNAKASDNAAPFWQSMGFIPTEQAGITHIFERPEIA